MAIKRKVYSYHSQGEPVDPAIWQQLWVLNRVLRPRGLPLLGTKKLYYDNPNQALLVEIEPRMGFQWIKVEPGLEGLLLTLIRDLPRGHEEREVLYEGITEKTLRTVLATELNLLPPTPSPSVLPILANLN